MHKSLVPVAREANVARLSSFNDLEKGVDSYDEYVGYGRVADVVTSAMLSPRSESQAIERALAELRDVRSQYTPNFDDAGVLAYDTALRWGVKQLETLLSASSSQPRV